MLIKNSLSYGIYILKLMIIKYQCCPYLEFHDTTLIFYDH